MNGGWDLLAAEFANEWSIVRTSISYLNKVIFALVNLIPFHLECENCKIDIATIAPWDLVDAVRMCWIFVRVWWRCDDVIVDREIATTNSLSKDE